jgi:hypothetical protein
MTVWADYIAMRGCGGKRGRIRQRPPHAEYVVVSKEALCFTPSVLTNYSSMFSDKE